MTALLIILILLQLAHFWVLNILAKAVEYLMQEAKARRELEKSEKPTPFGINGVLL